MPQNQQQGFLTWNAPGRVPAVRLQLDVIDRMTVDVMRGFGVTRRRGAEVGGVLLGKVDSGSEPLVIIYDYEIVPCEYSHGPSYILSDVDLEPFREAVERWRQEISPDQYVVGYFRSNTRDGLRLDDEDAKLFHTFLKDPLAVALLIKPFVTKPSEAGFFLQSNGKLEIDGSPLEFQFVRVPETMPQVEPQRTRTSPVTSPAPTQLQPIGPPRVEIQPVEPIAIKAPPASARVPAVDPPAANIVKPAPPLFGSYYPAPKPRWKERVLWFAFTLAVLGCGAMGGYRYAIGQSSTLEAASSVAEPYSVALSATAQNGSVLVRWNREAPGVKSAARGLLTIVEGSASRQIPLTPAELLYGTILYHPVGGKISFKMELFFRENRSFAESVALGIR